MIDEDMYDFYLMFCILSTLQPYETVIKCMKGLKQESYTTRYDLTEINRPSLERILKSNGCRFWNTKVNYFVEFGKNQINLKTASREEIVKSVKGIGMKLASMFLRDTRGKNYAVMDVHTKRWLTNELKKRNIPYPKNYEDEERFMLKIARENNKTIQELDQKIWNENRIGARTEKPKQITPTVSKT